MEPEKEEEGEQVLEDEQTPPGSSIGSPHDSLPAGQGLPPSDDDVDMEDEKKRMKRLSLTASGLSLFGHASNAKFKPGVTSSSPRHSI